MSPSDLPRGDVVEICHAIVSVPSEYGNERALADLVERFCRRTTDRVERIGDAVVARTGRPGEAVALVGHLDTVPNWPGGTVERDEDRIVGRGTADMKGGVAVMLSLLERLGRTERPLVFVFYDREEGPNADNGIHEVLRRSTLIGRPIYAVVLEPTSNTMHVGAVGTMNADVVIRGRAAHAARPWEGENAIEMAAGVLQRLAGRMPVPVETDGLPYHDTMTVTMAQGGLARNIVPERFTLGVNVRVAPSRSNADARAELEDLVGTDGEVVWLDESPPARPMVSTPAIQDFLAATGLEVRPKQAWTDVATLQAAGIPAFNLGPGDPGQAHVSGEHVTVAALRRCEEILLGALTT